MMSTSGNPCPAAGMFVGLGKPLRRSRSVAATARSITRASNTPARPPRRYASLMRILGNAGLARPFRGTVTVIGRQLPIDVLISIPVLATTGAARAVAE